MQFSYDLLASEVCVSKVLCEMESLVNDQLNVHDRHKESVYKIKTNEKLKKCKDIHHCSNMIPSTPATNHNVVFEWSIFHRPHVM